ncbi:MAG TPA: hypothetical protein VJ953_15120 [Saprospiraceae bacterium]|nr:hypothetical protein [Saprospiraceae bacterium]
MYRVKFETDEFGFEVESTDEKFVEQKISYFINLGQKMNGEINTRGLANPNMLESLEDFEDDDIQVSDGRVDPERIADVINNSKRFKAIENKILNKSNQLYRILLTLHYATATYGKRGYSTGLLEEITAALGKRLRKSNIAAQIKLHPDYFTSDREPGKGITALYLLTEEGQDLLEEKLNS